MKKIMTIAAAAATMLAVADGVESGIVGYQSKAVAKSEMVALAVQFKDPSATTFTVPVKDLVTVDVPKQGTAANGLTDQIHVWTGMAWKKYYNRKNVGWVSTDQADLTQETADTVSVGDGVFFKRASSAAANITTSGEVSVVDATKSVSVAKSEMKFLAYPWPTDFAIADFASSDVVSAPKSGTGANGLTDQVHVWTGMAWKKYYNAKNVGFVATDQADKSVPTTDTISVGQCVFFKRASSAAATITFTKPAGL